MTIVGIITLLLGEILALELYYSKYWYPSIVCVYDLNFLNFKAVLNSVKFKYVSFTSSTMQEIISVMISATTLMDDGSVVSLS